MRGIYPDVSTKAQLPNNQKLILNAHYVPRLYMDHFNPYNSNKDTSNSVDESHALCRTLSNTFSLKTNTEQHVSALLPGPVLRASRILTSIVVQTP